MRKQSRDARLAPILDPTERALIVVTTSGRLIHETPAASALLAKDADSDRVRERASSIGRSSVNASDSLAAREWTDSHRHCEVATTHARYALFALPAGSRTFAPGETVIVDVERLRGRSRGFTAALAAQLAALVAMIGRLRVALARGARTRAPARRSPA